MFISTTSGRGKFTYKEPVLRLTTISMQYVENARLKDYGPGLRFSMRLHWIDPNHFVSDGADYFRQ